MIGAAELDEIILFCGVVPISGLGLDLLPLGGDLLLVGLHGRSLVNIGHGFRPELGLEDPLRHFGGPQRHCCIDQSLRNKIHACHGLCCIEKNYGKA